MDSDKLRLVELVNCYIPGECDSKDFLATFQESVILRISILT